MMKVLIVDDSEALVQRLRSSLGKVSGVEIVGQAGDATEGTLQIRQAKPDVVILDVQMPGGSGIDVLENLKKDTHQPVVIMLSNYNYPQYRRKCLENGAHFYFDKSSEFHMVAEVLRDMTNATAT